METKQQAIKTSLKTFKNVIESNKWKVIKLKAIEKQEFFEAANARENEKRYLDLIPPLEEIEAALQIAMSE